MNNPKIIISGASGQLGNELKEIASEFSNKELLFFTREELSISDDKSLEELFEKYQPSFFINCAAYTAVDKAEEEKEKAFEINGTAVGKIATLCKKFNCKLLHISTDYVFDGNGTRPLKESDTVDPVNMYGASKLEGEQLAFKNNPNAIIIRTSWVYSFYGKNFVKTMMRLLSERESISVVSDQIGSPTYAADLAEAIKQVIESGKWIPGIYNFSNEGIISWFDFAVEIKMLIRSSCIIHPIKTEQFPTPSKRPKYSVLDKTKIQQTFSIELRDWKESLQACINKLQAVN